MGEQSGNDKTNPRISVLDDGEIEERTLSGLKDRHTPLPKNLNGEVAPPLSKEEFKDLEGKRKVYKVLGIEGRYHSDEIEPWDPEKYIRPTAYEDESQEPVSPYELGLAQDFLVQLQAFHTSWDKGTAGAVPGSTVFIQEKVKQAHFSLYQGDPHPIKDGILLMKGRGWGYDFLRKEFKDKIVDAYFRGSNRILAEKIDDRGGIFSNAREDRKLFAEILFHHDPPLIEVFGTRQNPRPLPEIGEEYNQNDTLGIFAKQYIYFLRFARGIPGKELIEPGKVKNEVQ